MKKIKQVNGWIILVNDKPLVNPIDLIDLYEKKKQAEDFLEEFEEDLKDSDKDIYRIVKATLLWK